MGHGQRNYFQEEEIAYTLPEMNLLYAVILRALADVGVCVHKSTGVTYKDRILTPEGKDAIDWFFSKDTSPFSFLWICDALNDDAFLVDSILFKIEKLLEVEDSKQKGHMI